MDKLIQHKETLIHIMSKGFRINNNLLAEVQHNPSNYGLGNIVYICYENYRRVDNISTFTISLTGYEGYQNITSNNIRVLGYAGYSDGLKGFSASIKLNTNYQNGGVGVYQFIMGYVVYVEL